MSPGFSVNFRRALRCTAEFRKEGKVKSAENPGEVSSSELPGVKFCFLLDFCYKYGRSQELATKQRLCPAWPILLQQRRVALA